MQELSFHPSMLTMGRAPLRSSLAAALIACAFLPCLSHGEGVTSTQEATWRAQIKAALFVPQPLPDLAPETHGRFEPVEGVVAERVTYGTQFGFRIPAIVYRPKIPTGQGPGLIIVNGHGGDKYSWYSFYSGILYAQAGAVVVTYDPAGEGERNPERKSGSREHDKVEPPDELGRRVGGLMVTDIMQAVSYLTQRPDVDPRRIGAMGYSMGSFILSITAAVETRLNTCVLVGGGNLDGPEGYWDKSKPMCQGLPYRALAFLGDRPAIIYALHASRGPTLIYNGIEDSVVAIPSIGESHFAMIRERTVRLPRARLAYSRPDLLPPRATGRTLSPNPLRGGSNGNLIFPVGQTLAFRRCPKLTSANGHHSIVLDSIPSMRPSIGKVAPVPWALASPP